MNKKIQVFISSTYTDLIEERQAAVEAILDAGHIPAGMELFKAGNKSQLETIYKWIDDSDVYMLILGGRYGSIEELSGKSYTQLEYEYAIKQNKPFFAIVLKKAFLHVKASYETDDSKIFEYKNITQYKEFKKDVMSKMVKQIDNLDQISTAIINSLQEYENDSNIAGWVRSDKLIEYNYDKFESLTVFLKKVHAYTDNEIPVSQFTYFKEFANYYINGVSEKENSNLYKNFSGILLYTGIIKDTIEPNTNEHILKMTEKGFKFYQYITINDL